MGHGPGRPVKTRGRPHGHGGRRSSSSSSSSTPHTMGSGPCRPVTIHESPHGPGRAAHIEPTSHGPRPGPGAKTSRVWAAARLGPSNSPRIGRSPVRPIKIAENGPRSDPAHDSFNFSRPGPARSITCSKVSARPGPARHVFQIGPARPGPDKQSMTSAGMLQLRPSRKRGGYLTRSPPPKRHTKIYVKPNTRDGRAVPPLC